MAFRETCLVRGAWNPAWISLLAVLPLLAGCLVPAGLGARHERAAEIAADPTPRNPLALRLAAVDPADQVLYLARPCQYTAAETAPDSDPKNWSSHRTAEAVVAAMGAAIDLAKATSGAFDLDRPPWGQPDAALAQSGGRNRPPGPGGADPLRRRR